MDGATTRDKIRTWIRGACARAFGESRGLVRLGLCDTPGSRSTTLVQEFVIEPHMPDEALDTLVDRIVGEAEMTCEGRGGGVAVFAVTAHRDQERTQCAMTVFQVVLEQSDALASEEATARGLLAQTMKQNAELHNANIQMVAACGQAMHKTLGAVVARLDQHEKVLSDTLMLLRAGSEQRQLEEAKAYATTQSTERWNQIFNMFGPIALGWAQQWMEQKQIEQANARARAEAEAEAAAAAAQRARAEPMPAPIPISGARKGD